MLFPAFCGVVLVVLEEEQEAATWAFDRSQARFGVAVAVVVVVADGVDLLFQRRRLPEGRRWPGMVLMLLSAGKYMRDWWWMELPVR